MKVLIIDNHESLNSSWLHNLKSALEGLGNRCEVRRFDGEHLSSGINQFDAIVLSGSGAYLSHEATIERYQAPIELIQTISLPILGICFGHQLIGIAFGSPVIDLGREVKGFRPVKILNSGGSSKKKDPLFYTLPDEIQVCQYHSDVVECLPKGFKLLAWSDETTIEAMVHECYLIYGIQFHAERYNSEKPHGKIVLQNFFDCLKN